MTTLITHPSEAKRGPHLVSTDSLTSLLALKLIYVQNKGKSQSMKAQLNPKC